MPAGAPAPHGARGVRQALHHPADAGREHGGGGRLHPGSRRGRPPPLRDGCPGRAADPRDPRPAPGGQQAHPFPGRRHGGGASGRGDGAAHVPPRRRCRSEPRSPVRRAQLCGSLRRRRALRLHRRGRLPPGLQPRLPPAGQGPHPGGQPLRRGLQSGRRHPGPGLCRGLPGGPAFRQDPFPGRQGRHRRLQGTAGHRRLVQGWAFPLWLRRGGFRYPAQRGLPVERGGQGATYRTGPGRGHPLRPPAPEGWGTPGRGPGSQTLPREP